MLGSPVIMAVLQAIVPGTPVPGGQMPPSKAGETPAAPPGATRLNLDSLKSAPPLALAVASIPLRLCALASSR
jgi:hypothetical protein